MRTFDRTDLVGAQGRWIGPGALDEAVRYAREREQFETEDHFFSGGSAHVSRHGHLVEAARHGLFCVARYIDQSESPKRFQVSGMAKVFVAMCHEVTTDAVRSSGAMVYERLSRREICEMQILQIYEGRIRSAECRFGIEQGIRWEKGPDEVSAYFPGQGSSMGMGKELFENFSWAKKIFEEADDTFIFPFPHSF